MPFSLAHPAAVVPLWRILGRRWSLSAFVIGSMVPDVPFFAGHGGFRYQTHTIIGLVTFCLPVGLTAWIVFQSLFKQPLMWMLPSRARRYLLDADAEKLKTWHVPTLFSAGIAVVIGALTHIVWDAVTHIDGFGVIQFPSLRALLFVVDGYHVYLYKVLQHGSTWLGFTLLASWLWKWWRSLPSLAQQEGASSARLRTFILVGMIAAPMSYGFLSGLPAFNGPTFALSLQAFSGVAVREAGAALAVISLTYSVLWQVTKFMRTRLS